jgi:hypothetical protein
MDRPFAYQKRAVHPLSTATFQLATVRELPPGNPTSPEECRLWLLPSDPDQVHSSPPCGTQCSTPRDDTVLKSRT